MTKKKWIWAICKVCKGQGRTWDIVHHNVGPNTLESFFCDRCQGTGRIRQIVQSAGQTETIGPATTWHDDYDPYDPYTHELGHA